MLVERFKQIQFGVFFDLHAQIVQLLNGCITCQKVQRTGAKGNDLQVVQPVDRPCNGQEIVDHVRTLCGSSYRILRNVRFHATQLQIVAGVEHAAVRITAAGRKHAGVFLGSGTEHLRTVKVLCQQRFGNFRTEVPQIDAQGIAAGFFQVVQSLYHVDLTLHDTDWTFVNIFCVVLLGIGIDQSLAAVHGQTFRKAVTADCNDADFHFRNIDHKAVSFLHLRCV